MKNRLIYKFISGFIAALLLSFLTVSLAVNRITYSHMLEKETDRLYHEATVIADSYGTAYFGDSLPHEALQNQFDALNSYLGCDIMLLAADGNIIIDTSRLGLEAIEGFDPTDGAAGRRQIGYFYGSYDEKQLTVFYPVEYRYAVLGYIVINKPVSVIRADANAVFNYNYLTLAIAFGFSGILIFIFYTSINKPLRRLTSSTELYAKGDFSVKTRLGRNDEIGRLADSLDYMASEIESLNGYQTKFLANISHDFRSPLTSIKGYLEAMLDGTIPLQMQEKYLHIVISETERLTKLTNNLLTMNNFNENGMVLDISDFDIIKIIKQTIETCEGECAKKLIKFKLVFSEKELYVTADQSKIQQVIYNLIDNAVKFSSSDSSIIVSASEKGDKISVSIKDFGIGIPKESISKIWERFYKTDLSRGKDKKGTGLGLSIVKDIIAAHKEYIDVVSTEGVGTEFIFALPKSKAEREEFI
ncbi:MAG: HAMP domain-containing histidine kinase [Butyrivibrio sp.]|nr:HAMP domain-containing histidine kinase [Butyrivibrio sp.]